MTSRRRSSRTSLANKPPSYTQLPPLALVEIPPPAEMMGALVSGVNTYLRTYRLGQCSVIVTKEFGEFHMSISHPTRLPKWDEVAEARYRILPDDVTMAMLLPPRAEYLNVNEHCLQLVQIAAVEMVGGPP